MTTPHKHATLIKAWADGAEIQIKVAGGWMTCKPSWNSDTEYRIKPQTIMFRNYLWTPGHYNIPRRHVPSICTFQEQQREPREAWGGFVKWLGDWQEVEVEV